MKKAEEASEMLNREKESERKETDRGSKREREERNLNNYRFEAEQSRAERSGAARELRPHLFLIIN